MYLCIAPLSRFYYPETRRFIHAFIIIIWVSMFVCVNEANLLYAVIQMTARSSLAVVLGSSLDRAVTEVCIKYVST